MPSTGVARRFLGRMFMPASTDPRTHRDSAHTAHFGPKDGPASCVPSQRFLAADGGESFTGIPWERKQIR